MAETNANMVTFSDSGIGAALNTHTFAVPVNQRSYAWGKENVTDLLLDFARAIKAPPYFLGTMVFTKSGVESLEVADGQQRLATTTILIAAIRDRLLEVEADEKFVADVENRYLFTFDMATEDIVPRLRLNTDDDTFFRDAILVRPDDTKRKAAVPSKASHELILEASRLAAAHVFKISDSPRSTDRLSNIKEWLSFVRLHARVVLVVVNDPSRAYAIFETLNDRGVELSQVDMLKNHLYDRAQQSNQLAAMQKRWEAMIGALEGSGYDESALVYIRQMWISYHGYVKEEDLYDRIREATATPATAMTVAGSMADDVTRYLALMNPAHPQWDLHTDRTKSCVSVLTRHLKAKRIRPLLLSIARNFKPKDVESAFELCIAWTVRFTICGGIGGGNVEHWYAATASKIQNREISDAKALAAEMKKLAPTDTLFEEAFSVARVSQAFLARYYLRALENKFRADIDPVNIPDEDKERVNLEHILPENPGANWGVGEEEAGSLCKRIGNLTLLDKKTNSELKSESYATKKIAYAKCPIELTAQIPKVHRTNEWGDAQISARQIVLAKLALETWPIKA